MEYWVDGYNLILRLRWNVGESLEAARARLIRAMLALGGSCRVYFDAQRFKDISPRKDNRGGLRVIFVRSGTADDAIANDLRGLRSAKKICVVTDDRELRNRSRQIGGQSLGVQKFAARLQNKVAPASNPKRRAQQDRATPGHVSKKDIADWLDYFGVDEDWQPDEES